MDGVLGGLTLGSIVEGGPIGILVFLFIAMLLGWIPTRQQLKSTEADRDAYREACERKDEIIRMQGESLQELLSLGRASAHALTSIQAMGAAVFAATAASGEAPK